MSFRLFHIRLFVRPGTRPAAPATAVVPLAAQPATGPVVEVQQVTAPHLDYDHRPLLANALEHFTPPPVDERFHVH